MHDRLCCPHSANHRVMVTMHYYSQLSSSVKARHSLPRLSLGRSHQRSGAQAVRTYGILRPCCFTETGRVAAPRKQEPMGRERLLKLPAPQLADLATKARIPGRSSKTKAWLAERLAPFVVVVEAGEPVGELVRVLTDDLPFDLSRPEVAQRLRDQRRHKLRPLDEGIIAAQIELEVQQMRRKLASGGGAQRLLVQAEGLTSKELRLWNSWLSEDPIHSESYATMTKEVLVKSLQSKLHKLMALPAC